MCGDIPAPRFASGGILRESQTPKQTNMRTITASQAMRIINAACHSWKGNLAEMWGKNIALQTQAIPVKEGFYKEMREACTTDQHKIFDEIFGKDEPTFKVGDWVTWTGSNPLTAKITRRCISFDNCWSLVESQGGNHSSCSAKYLRPATPEEIAKATCLPEGTPCLVRDGACEMWKLSYADGKGRFYNGKISTDWKQHVKLDFNNLPACW